ncbi:MAG: hypothetical protein WCF24_04800 [Acidimicrobiales bacterium]
MSTDGGSSEFYDKLEEIGILDDDNQKDVATSGTLMGPDEWNAYRSEMLPGLIETFTAYDELALREEVEEQGISLSDVMADVQRLLDVPASELTPPLSHDERLGAEAVLEGCRRLLGWS